MKFAEVSQLLCTPLSSKYGYSQLSKDPVSHNYLKVQKTVGGLVLVKLIFYLQSMLTKLILLTR